MASRSTPRLRGERQRLLGVPAPGEHTGPRRTAPALRLDVARLRKPERLERDRIRLVEPAEVDEHLRKGAADARPVGRLAKPRQVLPAAAKDLFGGDEVAGALLDRADVRRVTAAGELEPAILGKRERRLRVGAAACVVAPQSGKLAAAEDAEAVHGQPTLVEPVEEREPVCDRPGPEADGSAPHVERRARDPARTELERGVDRLLARARAAGAVADRKERGPRGRPRRRKHAVVPTGPGLLRETLERGERHARPGARAAPLALHGEPHELRPRGDVGIAGLSGELRGLVEGDNACRMVAGIEVRLGELHDDLTPERVVMVEQRGRAGEQPDRRMDIEPLVSGPSRRRQVARGALTRGRRAPGRARRPYSMGLLQVIAGDLVELEQRLAVVEQPRGEALVQLRAPRLRQSAS